MKEKIMLLDGHSIINRAFYAIPLLTTKEGQHTNAIYGFLNILFKLIQDEEPKYFGVSFDLPKPTFRHLKYSEYKGNRRKMPQELKSQVPVLKEILKKMNINIYEKEGYEADDILATIAKKAEKNGLLPIIVTGDRDLLQIASENIKIKIPKTKGGKSEIEDYFAEDVFTKYGVSPEQFIEVKALMGDASDNIPGVPSIGEKTAVKIIKDYQTVENAIENVENIKPKKASESLKEFKEQALLSKYLVTIDINSPINFDINNLGSENIFNQGFLEICKKYELKSIIAKFKEGEDTEDTEDFEYRLIETLEDAKEFFKILIKNSESAYKLIFDENIFLGISISFCEEFGTFLKISENLSENMLLEIFKPYFEGEYDKITHDLKTDIIFLKKHNIELKNIIFDTMIGAYILNSTRNKYEYNHIADEYLEKTFFDKEELLGKLKSKKFLFDIDKKDWLKYCIRQSYVSFLSKNIMKKKIKENEQEELFYNIEMPLIYVLADMEKYGITASEKELLEYRENLEKEIEKITEEIYLLSEEEEKFNINSPKQLGEVLFSKMELKGGKKTATGWSTSADILERIADQHKIIPKVLDYRTYTKLKSTYADGLLNVLDKETKKIHSNFKQTVTATGRISSTDPNLQNIPIKVELGHRIRKVFKPENDDFIFVDADYSQIELRVLAHLSEDENLIDAFNEGKDIHKITASNIFNKALDEVTSFERSAAKAINFGLIYGKQPFTLAQELGTTKKEAENYIDGYFEKYPKVKIFLNNIIADAKKDGYTKTIFNRIRYIPEITSSNFMKKLGAERAAMNMPIQGAAADIIKIAMVKVHNRIKSEGLKSRLILQVHDELLIETHKDEVEIVKEILISHMQNAVKFSVNLSIDIHTGQNWYDAK